MEMRLGGGFGKEPSNPDEWIRLVRDFGYGAVIAPMKPEDSPEVKKAYMDYIRQDGLTLAEVGIWDSPILGGERQEAVIQRCKEKLNLAEETGANCCVNVAGSVARKWDTFCEENYREDTHALIVDVVREIIDSVKPKRTFYTLEPMPWMVPDSPDAYLKLIRDIDREGFAVHMDYTNMINCPYRYVHRDDFIRECFQKLGPYTRSIHVKDLIMEDGLPCVIREAIPGRGHLDLGLVLRLAEQLGPQTPVFTEHLHTEQEYREAAAGVRAAAEKANIPII